MTLINKIASDLVYAGECIKVSISGTIYDLEWIDNKYIVVLKDEEV